jgi:hypothetical protein
MSRAGFLVAAVALTFAGFQMLNGADKPAPRKEAEADRKAANELSIKYAKIYTQLVQLDLTRAREMNRKTPGVFPIDAVRPLEQAAQVAELWQQQAIDASEGTAPTNIFIRISEVKEKIAQDDYQRAIKGNERIPNAISHYDIERLKLRSELASLRVAKSRALDMTSPTDVLHFQMGQLREDVLELQMQVTEQWAKK